MPLSDRRAEEIAAERKPHPPTLFPNWMKDSWLFIFRNYTKKKKSKSASGDLTLANAMWVVTKHITENLNYM